MSSKSVKLKGKFFEYTYTLRIIHSVQLTIIICVLKKIILINSKLYNHIIKIRYSYLAKC